VADAGEAVADPEDVETDGEQRETRIRNLVDDLFA
jgi:hypothetical protein